MNTLNKTSITRSIALCALQRLNTMTGLSKSDPFINDVLRTANNVVLNSGLFVPPLEKDAQSWPGMWCTEQSALIH